MRNNNIHINSISMWRRNSNPFESAMSVSFFDDI